MSEVIEEIDEADELAPLHAQIAAALPASWTLETLGSLCEKSQYGWTTKADKAGAGVKFLRTTDITPGIVDWSSVPYCVEAPSDLEKYLIKDGDILISRTGSIGVNYLVVKPEPAVFASYLIRFRPKTSISTKYLKYYLQSPAYWRAINTGKKGIAVQNVNATMLSRIPVPVAPPTVQDEIVAELEKQFSRLDEAVANLQRVKANLKRYKASVLKAAVEGRLVEAEATLARREGRTYETGEQLLSRILDERRESWQGRGKYAGPVNAAGGVNFPLPEGWSSSTLETITDANRVICYGILMPKENLEEGVLFVKVRDMRGDSIDLNALHKTSREIAAKYARASLRTGDVLLSIRGTYGRVAAVPPLLDGGNITQDTARIAVSSEFSSEFVATFLRSEDAQRYFKQVARGVAVKGVNIGDVRPMPIPVPPLAEQARIVVEVDRHLSIIREVEAEVDANLQRAQALRQATLTKAFSSS